MADFCGFFDIHLTLMESKKYPPGKSCTGGSRTGMA
jgi:hypothetical protein